MLRLVVVQALLFLLPFAVYAGYLYLTKRADVGDPASWSGKTSWLVIGGLALAIMGLVALSVFDGAAPGSTYVPAHYEDGKIVPGRFE